MRMSDGMNKATTYLLTYLLRNHATDGNLLNGGRSLWNDSIVSQFVVVRPRTK